MDKTKPQPFFRDFISRVDSRIEALGSLLHRSRPSKTPAKANPPSIIKFCLALLVGITGLFSQSAYASLCSNTKRSPLSGNDGPSTYTSSITNNLPADGSSQNRIVVHIASSGGGGDCAGMPVQIGEAPNVNFGAGPGQTASCTATDSNGNCYFNASSTSAGTFSYKARAVSSFGGAKFSGSVTFTPTDAIGISQSSAVVSTNGQFADGSSTDVLTANIRNSGGRGIQNVSVSFSGIGNCTTGQTGNCSVSKTSTSATTYSSRVTVGSSTIANLSYYFVTPPASLNTYNINITANNRAADGNSADTIQVIVSDANGRAVTADTAIRFTPPRDVDMGLGNGREQACNTGSAGQCSVDAKSRVAGSKTTDLFVGSTKIGTANYSFIPGAANAAHSGIRVVTDNALANSTAADEFEALVRDIDDNPVGAGIQVDIASPSIDVAFNGGVRGSNGSCTTSNTGKCSIFATNSNTAGGEKRSSVTLAGVVFAGGFTIGNVAYGASPVIYSFAPAVVNLQIGKRTSNGRGSHTFQFTVDGLQTTSDSITVVGTGSANGAVLHGVLPARDISITEVASVDWPDAPVSASCVDTTAPTVRFGTLVGSQLLIPVRYAVAGASLQCTFVNTLVPGVSGMLFSDDGFGGGSANDAIPNGGEQGLAGITVTLNNCGAISYATATTDGGGKYKLSVPASVSSGATLCVETWTSASRLATGGSLNGVALPIAGYSYSHATSGERIAFTWAAASTGSIDFASVPKSAFVHDGLKTGQQNSVVAYEHVFTAGTDGTLSFTVTGSVSSPNTPGWSQIVFWDPTCKQVVATQLYPGPAILAVSAGQVVCVVLLESVPPQAPIGSTNKATLQASFTLTHSNPALVATYLVDDFTTVGHDSVSLLKEVRNVTKGEADFSASNSARPADVLEYRITYANNSPAPVHQLVINDATPAYTHFRGTGAGVTPQSLTDCLKVTPAAPEPVTCATSQTAGGHGPLEWTFTGVLSPGASGSVLFQVELD